MKAIEFKELYKSKNDFGSKKVYYIVENTKSKVMEAFNKLKDSQKRALKDKIKNLADIGKHYRNKSIKPLKGYQNLYQITEQPYRFYYFTIIDEHIVIFDFLVKKSNQIPYYIYDTINKKREMYEEEFRRQKKI